MAVDKTLEDLLDRVNKSAGKGSLHLLSKGFERSPSNEFGLPSLDSVLNGGVVRGTFLMLSGAEGGGKTTLGLTLMGNNIAKGNKGVVLDAEHKLDPVMARNLGVDLSNIPFGQPDTCEKCFKIIDAAVDGLSAGDMILVDSIASLTPEAYFESGIDGDNYAGNSKEVSRGIHLTKDKVSKAGVIVILINQVREKLGVVYGSNITTPGGRMLKHSAETNMEVNKGPLIKDGETVIGQEVNVKLVKSGHAAPYVTINLELYFGKGFSKTSSLLDLAKKQGIIGGVPGWPEFNGKRYHGNAALIDYLSTQEGYADVLAKVKI